MKRKRCLCSMFCRNPAFVILDIRGPRVGIRTKRICIPSARSLLADLIANDEEAKQEQEIRDAESVKSTPWP